jgi:hypothetical protein
MQPKQLDRRPHRKVSDLAAIPFTATTTYKAIYVKPASTAKRNDCSSVARASRGPCETPGASPPIWDATSYRWCSLSAALFLYYKSALGIWPHMFVMLDWVLDSKRNRGTILRAIVKSEYSILLFFPLAFMIRRLHYM